MVTTGVVVEDVAGKIRAMDREFMDGVADKDAARVAAIYSEGARILMPGRPMISGKAEILSFWKAALDGPVDAITLNATYIEVSGDLAIAIGTNTIISTPEGKSPREEVFTAANRRATGSSSSIATVATGESSYRLIVDDCPVFSSRLRASGGFRYAHRAGRRHGRLFRLRVHAASRSAAGLACRSAEQKPAVHMGFFGQPRR